MLENLMSPDRWKHLFSNMDLFGEGLVMTLKVSILGLGFALIIGLVIGILSTTHIRPLKVLSRIYVEVFQNTPLVVQIFFYYNGFPLLFRQIIGSSEPIRLPKIFLGVLAVSLYHGAYISEVVRMGIENISKGQWESAVSQGFGYSQTLKLIIFPQTIRIIMPALANQALSLIKNTSVLALIAGYDLMYYSDIYVSNTMYLQGFILCALLYFVLCYPLAYLSQYLEKIVKLSPIRKKDKQVKEVL